MDYSEESGDDSDEDTSQTAERRGWFAFLKSYRISLHHKNITFPYCFMTHFSILCVPAMVEVHLSIRLRGEKYWEVHFNHSISTLDRSSEQPTYEVTLSHVRVVSVLD